MSKHFNGLTPAEAERLALLSEELGEAQQAIGKILRHGYNSSNPYDSSTNTNRNYLERELGDVQFAIKLMTDKKDLNYGNVELARNKKGVAVWQYLHHNKA